MALSLNISMRRLGASCLLALAMFVGEGVRAETVQNGLAAPASNILYGAVAATTSQDYGFKRGKIVPYTTSKPAGTVIISTAKNQLYYVLGNGYAVRYRVATAKKGFEWAGAHRVSGKVKWPDWRPPAEMRKRRPDLPEFMEGGPENPLGARAIYLGSSIYRIHGTNEPDSIGKAASSGCIRMHNKDVEELYRHIKMGATVIVL